MADAVIDLQASNIFSLAAAFKTTSSGTSLATTNVTVQDELGNVSCEKNITDITSYTQEAGYCGSDFVTDLGTFLTQFGNIQGAKVVTGLTINMTAGEYCTISVEGHNHGENAHAAGLPLGYADVSDFLPHAAAVEEPPTAAEPFFAWNGFGVPSFGVTTGANASPASATVTFSMNHVDQVDESGEHLVGKNITPRCELSMDFSGIPTSDTLAKLNVDFGALAADMLDAMADSVDSSDSNSTFDTFAFVAHAHTNLATA